MLFSRQLYKICSLILLEAVTAAVIAIMYTFRSAFTYEARKCSPDDELMYPGPLTSRPQNSECTDKRRFMRRENLHGFEIVLERGQPFTWKRRSKFLANVNIWFWLCTCRFVTDGSMVRLFYAFGDNHRFFSIGDPCLPSYYTLSLFCLITHRSCTTSKHTQWERPGFVAEDELRASGVRPLQDRWRSWLEP